MVRKGKSNQVASKPSVELCLARPTAPKSRIDGRRNLVVLTAKGAVSLQVAMLEQHFEHDELGVQWVDLLRQDGTRLPHPGDQERPDEIQKLEKRR